MTRIRLFSSPIVSIALISSLLAILLAGCTLAASPVSTSQPASGSSPTSAQETGTPASIDAVPASPLPIATSRGPELHATDPATVRLASGGVQLVEFFRFT